ncbi:MAG: hypothetical protein LBR17_00660 [Bacteroidales bacterium]|jgi:hypothetical protein|nr:hypothetical protein [Bacteroidales bacterium]
MKKVIILLVLVLSALSVLGQSPGVQSVVREIDNTGSIYTQKIAVLNTDTTIILSQAANGSHYDFYLVDENSNVVNQAAIPSNFVVNDFKILDNMVYFCGEVTQERVTSGYVARASVNDLFFYSNFDWDSIKTTRSIDKIQVYKDTTSKQFVQIVGIGKAIASGLSIFVHCDEGNSWNYDIYQNIYDPTEVFDDIILKDDYSTSHTFQNVFVIGRVDNENKIVVRKFDMYNISNTEDYYYDINATLNKTAPYPLVADSLIYKHIAVAGILQDNITGNEETNIFAVDIVGPSGAVAFFVPFIQTYGNYNKGEAVIRDLLFDAINDTGGNLLVLEDISFIPSNTLNSIYILSDPISTYLSYTADMIYSDINGINYPFNSLSTFQYHNFLAAGINLNNAKIDIWNADRNVLGGNCNMLINENITVHTGDLLQPINPLIRIFTDRILWNVENDNNLEIQINVNCN